MGHRGFVVTPPPPDQKTPRCSRRKTLLIVLSAAALLAVIALAIALVVHPGGSSTPTTLTSSYPTSSKSSLAKLADLRIKGRAPKTGYDRALFGPPWTDDVTVEGGHNGCDTRDDILRRDLTGAGYRPGNTCIALSGTLNDPYTGETIHYQRQPETLSPIQVDHIVPLMDAWEKGAQQWDELTRRNFANDPLNLQATTAAANEGKRSGDAATWLPSNTAYRCTYAARIVDVKTRYGLWITVDEHESLAHLLAAGCDAKTDPLPPPTLTSSSATPSRSTPRPSPARRPAPASPCYVNVRGECVSFPADFDSPPAGVNALCRDGAYSFSNHRKGSCARHGGVARWMD
ncbi:DUF1524 domain-containing protein [Mycolicibacter sp. MYC123]|uniref:DUF1524 domain-containing protein n=1 Tax=[Mycobacterium] zoologicum TaxID=2872311 RepID=A0ABU5YQK5_9MYCO|nr:MULTISPECIES: DUF1524 domain-containing protein [unclassified Mycolicibacter]MEB3052356.1 DUF1524 domain-containing protein [Mycolicibacter sp. MYC123]MEB3064774.1 DUF1524 domain-containing protein [Mycolicibacter sp. MYC101]